MHVSYYQLNILLITPCNNEVMCVSCVVRDFLTAEDKEVVFSADHFPLWYKRAAEQVPGTFIYSLPFNTGDYTHKTGSLITALIQSV